MPPLKGTARNLHTIQFILTEHFICYDTFSFSLFTARPYLKDLK